MQIDPNVKAIINGAVAICGVIATAGPSMFPDYIPAGEAKDIVQTAGLIFMIYGGLNAGGNLLSSSKPGALAPADPPSVVAAQKVADLTPDDPLSKVNATKQAAIDAVTARNPKAGPA